MSNGVGAVTAVGEATSRRGRERGDAASASAAIAAAPLDRVADGRASRVGCRRAVASVRDRASGRAVIRGEELERFELWLGEQAGERYTAATCAWRTTRWRFPWVAVQSRDWWFTWAPGVGFVGNYDLVFVRWMGDQALARHEVRIVLGPEVMQMPGREI